MEEIFIKCKRYVLDHAEEFRIEDENLSSSEYYVGNTKVCLYSGNPVFNAGMWLQLENHQLRIYVRNDEGEKVIWRSFTDGQMEGPVHQHDFVEIGYVVQGCSAQSFFGKDHVFRQGEFWLVDRHCFHSDKYSTENLFTVYIGIPSEVFDSAFVACIGNTEIQRFLSLALLEQKRTKQFLHFVPRGKMAEGGALMEQLLCEIIEQRVGFYDISKGLLARLLRTLSLDYAFMLTSQEKQKVNDLLFCEVEKYISNNYRTVTIQELVEHFHYNEDYYNRLIKKYSGCTYSEYVKNVRLTEAEKLLRNTELSVEQIAVMSGYQSRGSFYHMFVEKNGMTPAKYRNTERNKLTI